MINFDDIKILTNNPMVLREFSASCDVVYKDVTYEEILILARDLIHLNHKLLTHPLSGSVKPKETMYKSIIVSKKPGEFDLSSAELIENCIEICKSFKDKKRDLAPEVIEDFQLIDASLIKSVF